MSAPVLERPASAPGGAPQQSTVGSSKPRRLTVPGILAPTLASWGAVMLSALCLGPLFVESGWIGATLLSVTAVVAVVGLGTWLRLPMVLVPVVGALALFAALVARFTDDAPWGFVPTPSALEALRAVLAQGVADVNRFAPPVPVSEGLAAVTALGVGSVALVVAVLQVVLRLPTLAGVPLVAMYVVPSFVLADGSPWWAFVVVAAGWLLLLVTDERLTLLTWGRVLRRSDRVGGSSAVLGLSGSAFRLGALAVAVSLVLPVVVPGLADAVLGRSVSGSGEGDGEGSGEAPEVVGLDPLVSLRRDLLEQPSVTVLRYRTDAVNPSYLRAIVLEDYDGESWKARNYSPDDATPVADGVDETEGVGPSVARKTYRYSIASEKYGDRWLPVPLNPTGLQVEGDWYVDNTTGTVFSPGDGTTARDKSWQVEAADLAPTVEQLRAAAPLTGIDRANLTTSVDVPDSLREQAAQVVATAKADTDYDIARALEKWFRDNFRYSTQGVQKDSSTTYLEQFLKDRSGYCEQFSATMALMAISQGVRARVAVGYTPGAQNGEKLDDPWTVSAKNAHAWPELYFSGIGWVRFEPTPSSPADGVNTTVPVFPGDRGSPGETPEEPQSDPAGNPRDQDLAGDDATDIAAVDLPDSAAAASATDAWRSWAFLLLLLAVAAGALVPAGLRLLRRRRRLAPGAGPEAAWAELRDTAVDVGADWSDARTPRQAVESLVRTEHLGVAAAAAAERVGRTVERARYARTAPDDSRTAADVATVRHALLERRPRKGRLLAVLAPASLRGTGGAQADGVTA